MKKHQVAKVNIPLAMVYKLEKLDGNDNKTLTAIILDLISKEIDTDNNAEAHKVSNESTKINKEQNR
ncbi:hypothetical protein P7M42_07060 [Vibrio parahaemolyticus]|uniref:hypothetical protein n=1 Tax=Vibrio parahaemolyticus TaxID=670 RepID=UPI000D374B92|nr:hypothetical protein [Vibrio parahaemolyticus]MDG2790882.1 hypothetical protein [Vibrio parahaemolyticus]